VAGESFARRSCDGKPFVRRWKQISSRGELHEALSCAERQDIVVGRAEDITAHNRYQTICNRKQTADSECRRQTSDSGQLTHVHTHTYTHTHTHTHTHTDAHSTAQTLSAAGMSRVWMNSCKRSLPKVKCISVRVFYGGIVMLQLCTSCFGEEGKAERRSLGQKGGGGGGGAYWLMPLPRVNSSSFS
jgi:hypothetical protein